MQLAILVSKLLSATQKITGRPRHIDLGATIREAFSQRRTGDTTLAVQHVATARVGTLPQNKTTVNSEVCTSSGTYFACQVGLSTGWTPRYGNLGSRMTQELWTLTSPPCPLPSGHCFLPSPLLPPAFHPPKHRDLAGQPVARAHRC